MTQPQELVRDVQHLFSLPDVAIRVNRLIDAPATTAQQLSEAVQLDSGLAMTVLKLANSAWYGLPARVDTVTRAITLIGNSALRDLVLSTSVTKAFKGIPEEFVRMVDFWDNSVHCGVIARAIGQRQRLRDSERLFLAGLLHKVGRLVFYVSRAMQYRQVLHTQDKGEDALIAAEREVFGFTYAELGAALLKAWGLPQNLQNAIALQLEPSTYPGLPNEAAILHVASNMAFHMAPDIKDRHTSTGYTPAFDSQLLAMVGLSNADLTEVMQASLIQAIELIEIVNPGG
jgi:HD-like signal output (HDOD) protein